MTTLADLRKSISQMTSKEALELITQRRQSRRIMPTKKGLKGGPVFKLAKSIDKDAAKALLAQLGE